MPRHLQLLALLALAGCASSRTASEPAASASQQQHEAGAAPSHDAMQHHAGGAMEAMCPTAVPDTHVAASDTASGEAITFTTSGQVDELRRRVHAMAEMHNQHHAPGAAPAGSQQHVAMSSGMIPPSRTSVEDVEGGARVSVTPNDAADLERLRSTVRTHAEHMQGGNCGMMGEGMKH
jgi:hypothetical protein